MDENEHELEDFINYWVEEGIKVKIRPKNSWNNSIKEVNHKITSNEIERIACGRIFQFVITWDGDVVNCGSDMHGNNIWGNVSNKSINEIWNGIERKIFIDNHLNHYFDKLPEICINCNDWLTIGTVNFDETGKQYTKKHK